MTDKSYVSKRREGTFQLIETGEPFYPRHLSEDSKDFMRKVALLASSCLDAKF